MKKRFVEAHSKPPEFQQFRIWTAAAPRVGFREIENQIASRFHPHIGPDIAISNRHGAIVILAGGVPYDIVFFWESVTPCLQRSHGMNAAKE